MVFLCVVEVGILIKGVFIDLISSILVDVVDLVVCMMLEWFKCESEIGNFGIYCGNEVSGVVKVVVMGG